MRIEGAKPGAPSNHLLAILEAFAQQVSHALAHEFTNFGTAFQNAYSEVYRRKEAEKNS